MHELRHWLMRARIVLAAAEGQSNMAIAKGFGTASIQRILPSKPAT